MYYQFLSGAVMICCLVAGIFFYKFWKKTHEHLFRLFAVSFFLLSFERLVLGFIGTKEEPSPAIYLIRLSAFLIIIYAIVRKNKEDQ